MKRLVVALAFTLVALDAIPTLATLSSATTYLVAYHESGPLASDTSNGGDGNGNNGGDYGDNDNRPSTLDEWILTGSGGGSYLPTKAAGCGRHPVTTRAMAGSTSREFTGTRTDSLGSLRRASIRGISRFFTAVTIPPAAALTICSSEQLPTTQRTPGKKVDSQPSPTLRPPLTTVEKPIASTATPWQTPTSIRREAGTAVPVALTGAEPSRRDDDDPDGNRYGNDGDQSRCRGENCRGSFSPGPFDRSPVDIHDNNFCISPDCSGHSDSGKDGKEKNQK